MIRPYKNEDLNDLYEMLEKSGAIHFAFLKNRDGVSKQMSTGAINVVYDDGEVKGCLTIDPYEDMTFGKQFHLWLFTDLRFRGQGIGRALWAYALDYVKKEHADRIVTAFYDETEYSKDFFIKRHFIMDKSVQRMTYRGPHFIQNELRVENYEENYFVIYTKLVNDSFYDLRKMLNLYPLESFTPEQLKDNQLKQEFLNNKENIFLFFFRQDLIGYVILQDNYIDELGVDPKYQHQGYGKKILQMTVNILLNQGYDEIALHLIASNTKALRLYESVGFVKKELIKTAKFDLKG